MDKRIKGHLDLFSGIGGFSLGLEQAGIKPDWIGFSDIDKYANKLFQRRFKNGERLGSVTDVSYKSLKERRIDLLTGGFPCQSFSIAGLRKGFSDTRGTMFFEIERILRDYIENGKPIPYILLENVKGLLSHDNRRTFATIYKILADLNYTLECQVVNTKFFGLPQNRERIFILGRYNANPSGRKIFPIRNNDEETDNEGKIDIVGHSGSGGQKGSIHSTNGIMSSLTATDYKQPKQVQIADYRNDEGLRIRKEPISPCLSHRRHSRTDLSTMPPLIINKVYSTQLRSPDRPSLTRKCDCGSKKLYKKCCGAGGGSGVLYKKDGTTYCLDSGNTQAVQYNYGSKALNETLEQNDLKEDEVKALDLYNRKAQDVCPTLKNPNHADLRLFQGNKTLNENQTKKLNKLKVDSSVSGTLTEAIGRGGSSNEYLSMLKKNQELTGRIRKLTPIECERLQGFPDNWTDGQSDTQRYKQCGNAVSVNVIKSIMEKLYGTSK